MAENLRMTLSTPLLGTPKKQVEPSSTYTDSEAVMDSKVPAQPMFQREQPTGVVPKSSGDKAREAYVPPVKATKLESIGAGMGQFLIAAGQTVESMKYELDPNFDPSPLIDVLGTQMGGLSPEEVKYLSSSRTIDDWNTKVENMTDKRMRSQAMADNPMSGMLGSMVDADLLLSVTPIGGGAKLTSTASRVGVRAGVGATAAAGTAGFYAAAGDNTLRTPTEQLWDASIMGLAAMVAPMAKAPTVTPTPRGTPPAPTSAQRTAQQILDDLNNLNTPTGTPAQQVARHPIIAKLQSTADELNVYTKGDTNTVVNKLYSNPAINNGDDVVSAQNAYWNNYNHKLMGIEESLKDAVAATGVKGNFWNRVSGKYAKATQEVGADFQQAMQKLDADVLEYYRNFNKLPDADGYKQLVQVHAPNESIGKVMQDYIDSSFAMKVYDDAHASGIAIRTEIDATGKEVAINGMDDIVKRPTYLPLRHSYDSIEHAVNVRKIATMDEVADFVGAQIARMYPDLLNPKNAAKTFKLTERQIGQHFLQTQKANARGLTDVTATGMNKEQIADLLTKTGNFSDKEARITAASIFEEMHKKGTSVPKNLRRRIEWDWNSTLRTEAGHDLSMRDLVENNAMANLEDYARGMSHRIGLANYGLRSESELVNLLESYLSKLPEGTNVQKARQFMENTVDTLMGRAIENNPVPEGIRSAQAIADMFLLANSGLYTFMDIATQMQKVGLLRSLPAMKQGMKAMFSNLRKFNQAEAKELEDILTGRLLAGSRWKNFSVRYADNFEVSAGIHEAAQYYGQSARFMNLSESMKRFQVGVLTSVYANNLKKAMAGSASDIKFMKDKLKLSETLIKEIEVEYAKHGTKIDNWSNGTRVKYEQKLYHDADNLAMTVHRGEVPAILEHSAVGRIIFPYMRFAFGMQNKVLRRTLHRDGATGLAMLLALQIPTAMLIGAAVNVRRGEDPEKDLAVTALRSMSALGSLNYPMEIALAGLDGGGVTALAPAGKTYKFGKELLTGGADGEIQATQLLKNSPLNSNVVLDYLAIALED